MARPRNSGFAGDVTFEGKRYRSSGWKTDAAASAWEHQAMANLLVGKPVPPGPSEAEEATWGLKAMLDYVFTEHWSKSADPSYFEKQIDVLVKDLGPTYPAVDLATAAGYAALKAKCEARGNSGDTINKKASIISKAIKVSIENGKLQGIMKPQFARLPKGGGRERILTREEETACLGWARQCHSDFADWFVLGIDTGFRSYSEGLHIYPHVDVHGRNLTIRGRLIGEDAENVVVNISTAKRRTKTGDGKTRVVGLTNRAAEIVERHKKTTMHNHKLFQGSLTKQRITDLWNRMKEHLKITDPQFVPYSLRHTFGTRMILAQVRVEDLSVLMGHSTLQQTWKYVHLAGLVQTGAVNKLEEYLKG